VQGTQPSSGFGGFGTSLVTASFATTMLDAHPWATTCELVAPLVFAARASSVADAHPGHADC